VYNLHCVFVVFLS